MTDLRFRNPSAFLLGGVSQSGKTTFTFHLLRNIDSMFRNPECKQNVLYYYNQWQNSFDEFRAEKIVTEWINRVPTTEEIKSKTMPYANRGGSIIVIDDFAQHLTKDIIDLFSVLCHHTKTTVILLCQNIFSKNKVFRDISLNSTYVVLFKNVRDASQISHFAKQYAPGKSKTIVKIFKDATVRPYSYLLFDFHQKTKEIFRVRSAIFPHEMPMRTWIVKDI